MAIPGHAVEVSDLRAVVSPGRADTMPQNRLFVADIAADQKDRVARGDSCNRDIEPPTAGLWMREIEQTQPVIDALTAQSTCQACGQVVLLDRGTRRNQHPELSGTVCFDRPFQCPGGDLERLVPVNLAPLSVDLDLWGRQPITGLQAKVAVAVAIGQPALVDRLVVARNRAHDSPAPGVIEQVRPETVVRADVWPGTHFPGSGRVPERFVGQGADRTQVDDIARQLRVNTAFDKGADLVVLATIHAAQLGSSGDFGQKARAARAVNAARHVRLDQRSDILVAHHPFALGKA